MLKQLYPPLDPLLIPASPTEALVKEIKRRQRSALEGIVMADNFNTTVLTDQEEEFISLKVDVDGLTINVRIDGWEEPLQALKALFHLGQPERLVAMAVNMADALEEDADL